jgi:hypothetical protein
MYYSFILFLKKKKFIVKIFKKHNVGPYIISLFDINGEKNKIKMKKITFIIFILFLHPTYKNKF